MNILMGWLDKPKISGEFNKRVKLPYGITIEDIRFAMEFVYDVLRTLNVALAKRVGSRLEEIMRPNSFPDLLSTLVVRGISTHSNSVTYNRKHDGFPDLLPVCDEYENIGYYVHQGVGVEIKASKQKGGWQGHNPEEGWLMVFIYEIDRKTEPKEYRTPTKFIEVLAAKLTKEDWSYSGRRPGSRRTITASVNKNGVQKMRKNWIYRE